MNIREISDLSAQFGMTSWVLATLIFVGLLLSSFVKIATVLSIVRVGLGLHGISMGIANLALALGLTIFTMYPTFTAAGKAATGVEVSPKAAATEQNAGLSAAEGIWKGFLKRFSNPQTLTSFRTLSEEAKPTDGAPAVAPLTEDDWAILIPSFLVSELQSAFRIGLTLFLPFLIIDLVVAHVIAAVGLHQLSSDSVALCLKLLLFVSLDGWGLITGSIVRSYGG